jgi:hypothetical protein
MVNVHGGNRQIFQLGHSGMKAISQRHALSREPGFGHEFTSLFANLMIQWHGFQK